MGRFLRGRATVSADTVSLDAGADAHFSTTITYADGQVREESFQSHYRPWQAVCLIGVEKPSPNAEEGEIKTE